MGIRGGQFGGDFASSRSGVAAPLLLKTNTTYIDFYAADGTTIIGRLYKNNSDFLALRGYVGVEINSSSGGIVIDAARGALQLQAEGLDGNPAEINIVSGSDTVGKFDANATVGNTRFLLWDVDSGTLKRVSVGDPDSGGDGYKVLRIPN